MIYIVIIKKKIKFVGNGSEVVCFASDNVDKIELFETNLFLCKYKFKIIK